MAARVTIRLTPLLQPIDGECATCGFDSLARVKLFNLTISGVTTLADRVVCSRRCENH